MMVKEDSGKNEVEWNVNEETEKVESLSLEEASKTYSNLLKV